jgi:site-specific DNA-methyltransferase (adenine-specific)
MQPYYERDGITIYNADCRDVLPRLGQVDLVLTDPPFYLPARITAGRKQWPRTLSELAIMDRYYRDVFAQCVETLKETGAFYSFSDSTSYAVFLAILYPLFDRTQAIIWDKINGGLGNGWRHSHELIVHGAFSSTEYSNGFRRDVLATNTVPSSEREHASEKPISLLIELMCAHPAGITLDPFMGSGATLRAAKDLGRRCIGIELEERYCEIAAKRLRQGVLPLEVLV